MRKFLARPVLIPVLSFVLYLLLIRVAGCLAQGVGSADAVNWLTFGVDLIMAVCAAGVLLACGKMRLVSLVPRSSGSAVLWAIAFLVMFCYVWFSGMLTSTWVAITQTSGDANAAYEDYAQYMTGAMYWLMSLLVAPVTEELIFRGVIFGRLAQTKLPVVAAALISSVVFAFMHGMLMQFPATFLFGMFCCLVYAKTRTLAASMSFHVAYNLAALLLAGMTFPDFMFNTVIVWLVYAIGLAALVGCLCAFTKEPLIEENDTYQVSDELGIAEFDDEPDTLENMDLEIERHGRSDKDRW